MSNYFLNLLRPYPARPTKPVPSSKSVAGSVREETLPTPDFVATIDVVASDVESSDEGQPTKPKNIITIQKNKNKYFILPNS